MARSYSRVASTIWRDDDFVSLPPEQKLAYLMLISQPDVSPCGLLSVTLRRWATSLGITTGELSDALDGLVKARFVLWDQDAEELLIRSFVKWDGGLTNDNRTKAIVAAVDGIRSSDIYNAMLTEMDRLGANHHLSPRQTAPAKPVRTAFEPALNGLLIDFDAPRVVVTEVGYVEPQPTTLEPARSKPRERDRFPEFYDAFPKHVARQAAKRRWDTLVGRGVSADEIIEGARRYALEVRGVEPKFIKQPDGWLNAGRWEDEPARPTRRPSTPWEGV